MSEAVDTVPVVSIEDLPHYVLCDLKDCSERHYLTFSRTDTGDWMAAYIEFETGNACIVVNDAITLDEAAVRMKFSLERHKYREDKTV